MVCELRTKIFCLFVCLFYKLKLCSSVFSGEKISTHPQHLCKEFSDVPQHEGSQQALCACTFNTACKVKERIGEKRMKAAVRELRCDAS